MPARIKRSLDKLGMSVAKRSEREHGAPSSSSSGADGSASTAAPTEKSLKARRCNCRTLLPVRLLTPPPRLCGCRAAAATEPTGEAEHETDDVDIGWAHLFGEAAWRGVQISLQPLSWTAESLALPPAGGSPFACWDMRRAERLRSDGSSVTAAPTANWPRISGGVARPCAPATSQPTARALNLRRAVGLLRLERRRRAARRRWQARRVRPLRRRVRPARARRPQAPALPMHALRRTPLPGRGHHHETAPPVQYRVARARVLQQRLGPCGEDPAHARDRRAVCRRSHRQAAAPARAPDQQRARACASSKCKTPAVRRLVDRRAAAHQTWHRPPTRGI